MPASAFCCHMACPMSRLSGQALAEEIVVWCNRSRGKSTLGHSMGSSHTAPLVGIASLCMYLKALVAGGDGKDLQGHRKTFAKDLENYVASIEPSYAGEIPWLEAAGPRQ